MIRRPSKLKLQSQTLRNLSTEDMSRVHGGVWDEGHPTFTSIGTSNSAPGKSGCYTCKSHLHTECFGLTNDKGTNHRTETIVKGRPVAL